MPFSRRRGGVQMMMRGGVTASFAAQMAALGLLTWLKTDEVSGATIAKNAESTYSATNPHEVTTNSAFATDSAWNKDAGWTISSGEAHFVNPGANGSIYQAAVGAADRKTYRVRGTVNDFVAGFADFFLGGTAGPTNTLSGNGSNDFTAINTGTSANCLCRGRSGSTFDLDDFIIEEVGNLEAIISAGITLEASGPGVNYKAFDLDGANGVLTVGGTNLNGRTVTHFVMLLNPDTFTANDRILFKNGEWDVLVDGSGYMTATRAYSTTPASSVASVALQTGQWQLVEFYLDSTGDDIIHFRIDGVQADDASPTAGVGTPASNTNPLQIGKNASTNAFDGKVSNFGMSPTILDLATSQALANSPDFS